MTSYTLISQIIDDEGLAIAILEKRDISANEVIQLLANKAGALVAAAATAPVLSRESKQSGKRQTGKGCPECGSKGKRHKNGCSRAGGKKQASAAPRNDAISQMAFGRIKISQSHDVPASEIARNLSIDIAQVEKAFECETYSEYKEL